ncbi:IS1182 family transposase [Oleiphilus messinensis]|uniref:IS1182 family transposase n=1 Tax=Oleiphilus messinensis TaxID=141451 RepID=A0A1Y0I207_9GAMM|nr:IS1182 family transposase [Oleiphilus messinensis]ARU54290.1 IS1182 family transposase [Oleiphilus messinensis]ARU55866.1 IS1182 family transposase [Oleiphilus messinensis]ARU56923.1 IS1182 family transposase [Oleiphilus messinensis]
MAVQFKQLDRKTPYLLPPSVQDYLPEDHLACFVVEIVEQLDLSAFTDVYSGRGKKPYHPAMLVALLFYGYATGVFSSRKLEKAAYDSIAVRYICANSYPDHDTIATFRKRFLKEIEGLFVDILLIAETMGLLKLGTVSLDGTKIKANASKHKALSWEYANKLEEQLKAEVVELMQKAEEADNATLPEEMNVPEELARREQRLNTIAQAKKKIQARAKERFEREQAAYEEKVERRKCYEEETGKKPRGRQPVAPSEGPLPKDQVNLTDEESRIMPTQGGFEQAYNAQAGVDIETYLIVEQHLSQSPNDKLEVSSTLENLDQLPESLGAVRQLLADTGYFSEANTEKCESAGVEPLIPEKRHHHNLPLKERLAEDQEAPENPTAVAAMKHRLQTKAGREAYGQRKSTVETVFGIIKHVLGFRQFLLRGFDSVQSEWSLVCLAWNLKRIHALKVA